MSELANLQKQFQHFILAGQSAISDSIINTEQVSVDTRLAIYRDAYKLRLIECLTANFSALHFYLGTEEFHKLCGSYIDTNPSSYRSIRWYGHLLASFIKTYYKKPYAFLAELADFEWHMTLAFDAPDETALSIENMATVAPEAWAEMRFRVHPSVFRLNHFWNAIPLWQTLIADQDIPSMVEADAAKPWVLWRSPDYIIQFYSLSGEETWMLDALTQGVNFATLCEGLCQWIEPEQVAMKAASYLKNWIQKGILAELMI